LKLSDLSSGQLSDRLKSGLSFQTGAFTFRLTTKNSLVATSLHKLYADYVVNEDDFADFHIQIDQANGIRRWIRPQALFHFDGFSPFKPLPLNQAFPLLEWGMNWCVSNNAHSYLIIHAAVIEKMVMQQSCLLLQVLVKALCVRH